MKKIVALYALVVLSVQVLPVEQIGDLLGGNFMNEGNCPQFLFY